MLPNMVQVAAIVGRLRNLKGPEFHRQPAESLSRLVTYIAPIHRLGEHLGASKVVRSSFGLVTYIAPIHRLGEHLGASKAVNSSFPTCPVHCTDPQARWTPWSKRSCELLFPDLSRTTHRSTGSANTLEQAKLCTSWSLWLDRIV